MRTSLGLCFCLLTLCGITLGQNGVKVVVEEDSDVVLPCLISTKEDIVAQVFFWRKDVQKDVFFYDAGIYYNNGFTGQDEQFKGRVSHFQDQLKNGNASIKIQNTKMADSGNYSCIFPRLQPSQTFYIELVVGASPRPYVTTLDETKDWSLLQCEVQGASPEPKVEWQDSSGNILPAEEPQVSERGGRYYVTLKTTVTKTDRYRCVVTQEEISHQTSAEIFVFLSEPQSREVDILLASAAALVLLTAALLLLIYLRRRRHLPGRDLSDLRRRRHLPGRDLSGFQRWKKREQIKKSDYDLQKIPPPADLDIDTHSTGGCDSGVEEGFPLGRDVKRPPAWPLKSSI